MKVRRMTLDEYERRTCKCSHDVREHKLIEYHGACRACGCNRFAALDNASEQWAAMWARRLTSPWWIGLFIALFFVFIWCAHWLAVNDPKPWYGDIIRTLFLAYCLRPGGWIIGGPIALIRKVNRWIDKAHTERPYDRLQLERIEREARK